MNFAPIKRVADKLCERMLPGACVRVAIDGLNAFEYHMGFYDVENELEYTGDEKMCGYSMTKPVSACLALKACELGVIDLNTPLKSLLNEFSDMSVLEVTPSGKQLHKAQTDITIYQLLSMSAGFGDDMRLILQKPTREAVSALAEKPLLFEPGTRWLYGLCYEVLGAALEHALGKSLNELFRQYIFGPCGMKDTCFLSEISDYSQIVPMYRANGDAYVSAPLDLTYAPHSRYYSAGAGLMTTPRDYEKFMTALIGGGLISNESLSLMTANSLAPSAIKDFNWPQTRTYSYGLGVRVPALNSPHDDFGWGGVSGAYSLMDTNLNACMCFFTNVINADETIIYPRLRKAFYECFEMGHSI